VRGRLPDGEAGGPDFVLALDGEPVARSAPHGGRLRWLLPA
jgi:hypothetical protein